MLQSFANPLRQTATGPLPLSTARLPVPPLGALGALAAALPSSRTSASAAAAAERDALAPLARCLAHMLDEIDYGMLLVEADGHVLHINHSARRELEAGSPLQLAGNQVVAQDANDASALQEALAQAQRGKRRLLTLGSGERFVAISVVPLDEPEARHGATALILNKRSVCEELSVLGYARAKDLTPAETRVLALLCRGVNPTQIASDQGVAVSTVRTQIGSIRAKTGTNSIRELVRQVAVLPPLVGALRGSAATYGGTRVALMA